MEHQPFETWILEETPLNAGQERELHGHLQTCPACRALQQRWQSVVTEIHAAPAAAPQPGFSARFQHSLADRRAFQHKLQVRRALLYSITGAVTLMVAFAVYLLWNTSPVDWVVWLMEGILRTITTLNQLDQTIRSWMQFVPLSIPLAIWMLLSTGFVVLVFGWLFTLWRITTQGVNNK